MTFLYVAGRTMSDLNENSLAVRLDLGSKRVLLMGDAGAGKRDDVAHKPKPGSPESKLIASRAEELDADVLVVGHHGSKTASRKAFLDAVTPELSVISSGPKEYDHVRLPDAEVVELLQSYGPVFRTDRDDDACLTNPAKIGHDNDGKPGGCDNVRITLSDNHTPKAEYWTAAD
jgi:beta-lactamase superfamily II metal-dependent hydrolase